MPLSHLDGHGEIRAFPALRLRPKKSKYDRMSGVQTTGRNVCHVDSQAGIAGRGVLGRLPAVAAPMDHRRGLYRTAQCLSGGHNSALVVEPPFPERGLAIFYPVPLYGLRVLIENLAIPQSR